MRRTEPLQGVRMAVFLNLLRRWESAELSQEETAELLGVSERTFRRWTRRYEEEGEAGLVDRRLGKASGKRVPADRAEEVERLYRERYQGFTVRHFHEHLIKDHGFGWGGRSCICNGRASCRKRRARGGQDTKVHFMTLSRERMGNSCGQN